MSISPIQRRSLDLNQSAIYPITQRETPARKAARVSAGNCTKLIGRKVAARVCIHINFGPKLLTFEFCRLCCALACVYLYDAMTRVTECARPCAMCFASMFTSVSDLMRVMRVAGHRCVVSTIYGGHI